MKKHILPGRDNLLHVFKSHPKLFYSKWLMLLLLFAFAAGCQKVIEQTGLTGVCPKVVSTSPADTASGVSLNKTISATFNEPVNATTINAVTFTIMAGSTPVAGLITYTDSTATFSPTSNLKPNTTYTGTITKGVKDLAGNSPFRFAFCIYQ